MTWTGRIFSKLRRRVAAGDGNQQDGADCGRRIETLAVDGTGPVTTPQERSREIADRGAVEAGDHPVAQAHYAAGRVGEFQECECQAASLDAGRRETAK